MEYFFDEFSKSLAASVPRRESLRRIGAILAGAVLSPLGLGTAWAGGQDPCKSFCNRCSKSKQNQCIAACWACNGDTRRLGGNCGNYVCCTTASCNGVCSDLRSDPNCGACGNNCQDFGKACCSGQCTAVSSDPQNCGACGNVCPAAAPHCSQGTCSPTAPPQCPGGQTWCSVACYDLYNDSDNCGTSCENRRVCGLYENCTGGACVPND